MQNSLQPSTVLQIIQDCAKGDECAEKLKAIYEQMLDMQIEMTEQLYRSEMQLQVLLDKAPVGIMMSADMNTDIQSNQSMADFLGYTREEIETLPHSKYIEITSHADTRDEEMHYLAEMMRGSRDDYRMEKKYIRKDGTECWADLTTHVMRDATGRLLNSMSIVIDITDRKTTEQALQDSEHKYRTVINTMLEGMVMQDATGVIMASNHQAEEILGLTLDQMTGRTSTDPRWQSIREDGSDYPGTEHPAMIALKTGKSQHHQIMGVHKPNGSLTWISINSEPLFYAGNDLPYAVVSTFSDVTVQRQQQDTFFKMKLEEERATLLTQFIQNAAHEFRTPLSIINSGAYLILRTKDDEKRQRFSDNIRDQVKLINHLVDDLVLMSELESGSLMNQQSIDVSLLLRQIIEPYKRKSIHNFNLTYEGYQRISGDTRYLVIAINKLIDNAIFFTPEDGHIHIHSEEDNGKLSIRIVDTGKGMTEEEVKRVFERFWRADEAHTSAGFGLGASIARNIIQAHDGEIYVNSESGKGTEFIINLPRYDTPATLAM
ncbi:MAG: PAS domain-containing sensor histidine kinase [Aggregatilineales bacterium]